MNNEIFDNIKSVVTDTAQVITKKSGELFEASKIQLSILELNRHVRKLYNDIGRLTYGSVECGEDNAGEIQMKCDIIKAKLAKIEILKSDEVKSEYRCPVCGKPNDINDRYCSSCGVNMSVDADVDIQPEDIQTEEKTEI